MARLNKKAANARKAAAETERATIGATARETAQIAKAAAKDAYALSKDIVKKEGKSTLAEGVGRVIDIAKKKPTMAAGLGVAATALVLRHHRKKKNDNIGSYSSTIARGYQHGPSGSAAGMNNASSAWIQPNGAGYANPMNQGAKLGFSMGYPQPPLPTMTRPQSYTNASRVVDTRYGNYNVAQDQQLSSMI